MAHWLLAAIDLQLPIASSTSNTIAIIIISMLGILLIPLTGLYCKFQDFRGSKKLQELIDVTHINTS